MTLDGIPRHLLNVHGRSCTVILAGSPLFQSCWYTIREAPVTHRRSTSKLSRCLTGAFACPPDTDQTILTASKTTGVHSHPTRRYGAVARQGRHGRGTTG